MTAVIQTPDSFIASLLPDSDKKMVRIAGVSLLVAILLCFWATTYEVLIDDSIFVDTPTTEIQATMNIIDKKEKKKPDKKPERKPKNIYRKKPGSSGKTVGRGNPRAPIRRSVLHMLESQTANASADVYKSLLKTLTRLSRIPMACRSLVKQKLAKSVEKFQTALTKACLPEAVAVSAMILPT